MGQAFLQAEPYLDQLDPGRFIEIGTSRNGDSGSTPIIAEWAKKYSPSGRLTTVDMDSDNCNFIRQYNLDNLEIINKTGEDYLANDFPHHTDYISFLYLDNFDWDWFPEHSPMYVIHQKQRYAELGFSMTNLNSQATHLVQAELAVKSLSPKSIVVCDDTFHEKIWDCFTGKGGAVVPLLIRHGFKVVYTEERPVYGTILARGIEWNTK